VAAARQPQRGGAAAGAALAATVAAEAEKQQPLLPNDGTRCSLPRTYDRLRVTTAHGSCSILEQV